MADVRERVIRMFLEVLREAGVDRAASDLGDDVVLLQSGLDSMGFAILVTRLEETLGYDPFVLMETAVYPKTLGEFIEIYKRFADRAEPEPKG